MADGQTKAEALENVGRVAEKWVETGKELGRKIPRPKGRLMFA